MFVAANCRVMAHGVLADGVVLVRGAAARDAGRRRPAVQLAHRAHTRRYTHITGKRLLVPIFTLFFICSYQNMACQTPIV